jgi:hypothetical protein
MRPLANPEFNPNLPTQTILGTKQALRCSSSTVHELANRGELDRAGPGRITTESIFDPIRRRVEATRTKMETV